MGIIDDRVEMGARDFCGGRLLIVDWSPDAGSEKQ